MKAIILAAGKGSRISNEIEARPKSTLEINGVPIIRKTTQMLLDNNVDVSVCVGYRYQDIQDCLSGLNVTYYNNPQYDSTNNIYSLWLAQDELRKNDDTLIISADVVFSEDMLKKIIDAPCDLAMVTDKSRVADGDYFFALSDKGEILEYGPKIPLEQRSCEYVGISKISAEACNDFTNRLCELIDGGHNNVYFENTFFSFLNTKEHGISTIDVSEFEWREIDFYADYQKALKQFEEQGYGQ